MFDLIVSVEQIHRLERDHFQVFVDDVNAGFFDRPDIEVVRVHKIHNDDPEKIVIVQIRRRNLWQTTQ